MTLPDALVEIARLTAQVETLQGELKRNVNEYIEASHDMGIKLDAAEAQVTELRALMRMLLSACGHLLVASLRQQIRAALGEQDR